MNINRIELSIWEIEQDQKELEKVYAVKRKVKDPKKNKQFEYQLKQKRNLHWYKKEHAWIRKNYQKKFRQRWREEINKGNWHRPINKEYHTYGYLTW